MEHVLVRANPVIGVDRNDRSPIKIPIIPIKIPIIPMIGILDSDYFKRYAWERQTRAKNPINPENHQNFLIDLDC